MNSLSKLLVATAGVAAIALGTNEAAQALSIITFNEGVNATSVSSFYSNQGVSFSNTRFSDNFSLSGSSGSLGIAAINSGFQPKVETAIVGFFNTGQNFVSIRGIDVGTNGIRIDAYDAPSGGNLLGFDQFFGATEFGGGSKTLRFSTAIDNILRFEIYQPLSVSTNDAVIFDDLAFNSNATPVPFEFSPGLGILALGACAAISQLKSKTQNGKL